MTAAVAAAAVVVLAPLVVGAAYVYWLDAVRRSMDPRWDWDTAPVPGCAANAV